MREFNLSRIPFQSPILEIPVSQYDKGEEWRFNLYTQGVLEDISGVSAILNGTKPDGTGFSYACSIEDNQIVATLEQQMTAVAGKYQAEIRTFNASENLGTYNFTVNVERSALDDSTVISDSDIPVFESLVEQASDFAQQSSASATLSGQYTAETKQMYDELESIFNDLEGGLDQIDTNKNDIASLNSSKQDTITGGASTITSSNLTANRALISDGSGKVAVSGTTATQLGYINSLTSNAQTQINNLSTRIDSNATKIGNVETAYKDADDGIKQKLIDFLTLSTSTAFTYQNGCSAYSTSGANQPMAIRRAGVVMLKGAIKFSNTAQTTFQAVQIATLPAGFRPSHQVSFVCNGTGANKFVLQIGTDGVMTVDRYGTNAYTPITAGAWLYIGCTFVTNQAFSF